MDKARSDYQRMHFLSRTAKHGDCLLWTGAKLKGGYGASSLTGIKERQAHRIAWLLFRGPIPNRTWVLHHCDNPPCVNPEHLYLGGPAQNSLDISERKRRPEGEAVKTALLTNDAVRYIRDPRRTERDSALAVRLGVSQSTIMAARKGRTWKHLAMPEPCPNCGR